MEKRFVYADHSATTPVTARVRGELLPFFGERYGNPSSLYRKGREARAALEDARRRSAAALRCAPSEIFFTSGGTEADNWALKGIALAEAANGRRHLITTAIEHHAVLHACAALEKLGFEITLLPVDRTGAVDPDALAAALRPDTALVSVMAANNEVGTIEPIDEIGALCRERDVLFHTDAVQAVGNLPFSLGEQPIDLLSLSGHKIGAPKGVGLLYVRRGVSLLPLIDGGGQERGLRSGTENVAFAVGLAAALEDACRDVEARAARKAALRDRLFDALLAIPGTSVNGGRENRLCGNVNVSFAGVSGGRLLAALDYEGIAASAGSACSAGSSSPSHVLKALGVPPESAAGALRLTLGDDTTDADVDYLIAVILRVVAQLRRNRDV